MPRKMRRKKQALPAEEASAILHREISEVLALSEDDDYPYAVPISYAFDGAKLYFRCIKDGHKLDATQCSSEISSCIINQDQIVSEKHATYLRSIITFGQICIIRDEKERRAAVERLTGKYSPDGDATGRREEIDQEWKALCMLGMCIDHMTGEEAMDLCQYFEKLKAYVDFSSSSSSSYCGVI